MLYSSIECQTCLGVLRNMQSAHVQSIGVGVDGISFIMPLSQMLRDNPDVTNRLATEAYKVLFSNGKCDRDDYVRCYGQMAYYGVLLSGLVYVYSVDKGSMDIYTSSYSLILQLANRGLLRELKEDTLSKVKEVLFDGNRISKTIVEYPKKCELQAVKLIPEKRPEGVFYRVSYTGTKIDMERDYIIPYHCLDEMMTQMDSILSKNILKITTGDRECIVTKNISALSEVYDAQVANELASKKYDIRMYCYYAPVLGSVSQYERLKFENIDRIDLVPSVASLNLSSVPMDTTNAPEFCYSYLDKLTPEQLAKFAEEYGCKYIDLQSVKEDILVSHGDKVYKAMERCGFFPLGQMDALPKRLGNLNEAKIIPIPQTVADFERLLNSGIFRITLTTRTGRLSTVYCTNSSRELRYIYGNGYILTYESIGNRIRMLKQELKYNYFDGVDEEMLTALCNKWGTQVMLSIFKRDYPVGTFLDCDSAIEFADRVLSEKSKSRGSNPNAVTVRNIECIRGGGSKNFYRRIDINSIEQIERLPSLANNKVGR